MNKDSAEESDLYRHHPREEGTVLCCEECDGFEMKHDAEGTAAEGACSSGMGFRAGVN